MGIYSRNLASSAHQVVEVEATHYAESMSIMDATLTAVAESQENWNQLMKAVGCMELSVMENTGAEIVYEASSLKDFFTAARNWFIELLKKIKGIFTNFLAKINSFVKSDKEFVKKYKVAIAAGAGNIPSTFSMKGHKYENLDKFNLGGFVNKDVATYQIASYNNSNIAVADVKEAFAKAADKRRGSFCGETEVEAKDFSKTLAEYICGEKEELDKAYVASNITKMISDIETAKDTIDNAKKALKTLNDAINTDIQTVKKVEAEYNGAAAKATTVADSASNSNLASMASMIVASLKDLQQINTTANGIYLRALKDRNRQNKAICVKMISFSKKKPVEESTQYEADANVVYC